MTIDLDPKEDAPDAKTLRERAAARRSGRATEKTVKTSRSTSGDGTGKTDTEFRSVTDQAFDRLADWRSARDDEELAEVFREDGAIMANALVVVTNSVKFLRKPLFFLFAIVVPALAFERLGRILIGRFVRARQAVMPESMNGDGTGSN